VPDNALRPADPSQSGDHAKPADAAYSVRRSSALLKRIRKSEALIDARPGLYFTGYERIGGYPVFVERAKGAKLRDVDGNIYTDYLLGFGSVVLGHAHPEVNRAVIAALQRGVNPSLIDLAHLDLAERVVELVPAADCVTFLKTGSDAVDAAVRLARAVTGRARVINYGYHGWHDWCSTSSGVPEAAKALLQSFRYNDLAHAEALFAAYPEEIACIVMMPYEIDPPAPGYLNALKELAHRNGALFILDEVRSGFRIGLGGAQAHFNVSADLSAFGKAMANGHAISALAGRRAIMGKILQLGLTVTYFRSPDAMAAALATLKVLERDNVPERLARLGARLMSGLDEAAHQAGVPAHSIGLAATPFIEFEHEHKADRDRAMRLFCNAMLSRGHLMTPAHHWFICAQMSDADIDHTVRAAGEAFAFVRRMI
jgi:glutamate-1-semialdehyde 2,1-aminomutase